MSAHSGQDEDWSIISSSSDLEDDLSSSYHRDANHHDLGEAGLRGLDKSLDKSQTQSVSYVYEGNTWVRKDKSFPDLSLHTITTQTGVDHAAQEGNSPQSAQSVLSGDYSESVNLEGRDSNFGGNANCGIMGKDAHGACVVRNTNSCNLFSRVDSAVRFVSAWYFDLTLGAILRRLHVMKRTCGDDSKTQNCTVKRTSQKVINGTIDVLEFASQFKEIWLYQTVLVFVTILAFFQIHLKVASPKEPDSMFTQIQAWVNYPAWQNVYEKAMYEDGPVSHSFFGFSTAGPKRLRVLRYYDLARQECAPLINRASGLSFRIMHHAQGVWPQVKQMVVDHWPQNPHFQERLSILRNALYHYTKLSKSAVANFWAQHLPFVYHLRDELVSQATRLFKLSCLTANAILKDGKIYSSGAMSSIKAWGSSNMGKVSFFDFNSFRDRFGQENNAVMLPLNRFKQSPGYTFLARAYQSLTDKVVCAFK